MHAPNDADLLSAWERGRSQSPVLRSLLLLATAAAEETSTLAAWPLGKRDSRLLDLRSIIFGRRLTSVTNCPQCDSRLELDFSVDEIRAPFAEGAEDDFTVDSEQGVVYRLRLRPLSSDDLLAVAADPQPRALLARCTLAAHGDDTPQDVAALPDDVASAVEARLAELDPQADVRLALRCADCAHAWTTTFDIGAFLWQEIDAWAQRLLREIHILASAYGWREPDILALSETRRRAYLELVTG